MNGFEPSSPTHTSTSSSYFNDSKDAGNMSGVSTYNAVEVSDALQQSKSNIGSRPNIESTGVDLVSQQSQEVSQV